MATITGGQKLAAALTKLAAKVSRPATLRVGFLSGATYPNGTPVAMVAAIQEYGSPKVGIPPRPFMRTMIAEKSPSWPKALKGLLKANDYDAARALDIAGEGIADQLRESIIALQEPALSPVTLMLRKMFGNDHSRITFADVTEARRRVKAGESYAGVSTKPLVWTGHLLNSVDHDVKTTG